MAATRSLLTVPLAMVKQPQIPPNYPLARGELPVLAAGPQVVRGYANAPRFGVRRVEVRVDGGAWQQVRIIDPQPSPYTGVSKTWGRLLPLSGISQADQP